MNEIRLNLSNERKDPTIVTTDSSEPHQSDTSKSNIFYAEESTSDRRHSSKRLSSFQIHSFKFLRDISPPKAKSPKDDCDAHVSPMSHPSNASLLFVSTNEKYNSPKIHSDCRNNTSQKARSSPASNFAEQKPSTARTCDIIRNM